MGGLVILGLYFCELKYEKTCVFIVLNIPGIEKIKYFRFAAEFGSLVPQ